MRRAVERYLEDPLAEEILKGNVKAGDLVQVTVENGKLVFKVAEPHDSAAAKRRAAEAECGSRPTAIAARVSIVASGSPAVTGLLVRPGMRFA